MILLFLQLMLLQMYQTRINNPKLMMVNQPAQSAFSCESSVIVENNQYNQNRHWKKKSKNATNAGEFTAPEGPISGHFTDCTNPIDIFFKYLDTEIIDNILYQSNLYITQKKNHPVQNLWIEESLLVFWV